MTDTHMAGMEAALVMCVLWEFWRSGDIKGLLRSSSLWSLCIPAFQALPSRQSIKELYLFSWTREEAVSYMVENTDLSESGANSQILRYIRWPGQACAYKIGQLKLKELRKTAEDKLGWAVLSQVEKLTNTQLSLTDKPVLQVTILTWSSSITLYWTLVRVLWVSWSSRWTAG